MEKGGFKNTHMLSIYFRRGSYCSCFKIFKVIAIDFFFWRQKKQNRWGVQFATLRIRLKACLAVALTHTPSPMTVTRARC